MKYLLIIVVVIFSMRALWSQENKRSSDAKVTLGLSHNDYKSYALALKMGIDKTWAVGVRTSTSNDESDYKVLIIQNENKYDVKIDEYGIAFLRINSDSH